METDLFRALLDSQNSREHPILLALLYEFCPMAAYWWEAGADPVLPGDQVWLLMEKRASGKTLREVLEEAGLGDADILENVRKYRDEIDRHRSLDEMKRYIAPELGPYFRSDVKVKQQSYGLSNNYANVGAKSWDGVLEFVRLWLYVFVDWQQNMHAAYKEGESEVSFKPVRLAFTPLAGLKVVYFPGWWWRVKGRSITSDFLGVLLEDVQKQDQLKFALLAGSLNADEKYPWKPPFVWALDRKTGEAAPYYHPVEPQDALAMIEPLAHAAKRGPYPPLNALRNYRVCRECGFKDQCYKNNIFTKYGVRAAEKGL